MKTDYNVTYQRKVDPQLNHINVNKRVKAVIVNFGDTRGDIIVTNDNFGTRRKYASFTEGKKKAHLNPYQFVFNGIDLEKLTNDRYIDDNNNVQYFKNWNAQ
jgi:hypothetical protein